MESEGQEQAIIDWIRRHLDAEVIGLERQPRWRPAWFVEAQRGSETLRLYVRGERVDARIGFDLNHEMRLQKLLHDHGIPVPRVHGWMDEPTAYVMDRVEGVEHLNETPVEARAGIMEGYMKALAQIHALDTTSFIEADIIRAGENSAPGRIGMEVYEKAYRANKKRPDPFLEFTLNWLRRNPPPASARESVILWDTGQFLHDHSRLQTLIDLEIGHLGDPMMDLAGFRMRAREIGFSDFDRLYGCYEAESGQRVNREAIRHHYFSFALCNQLAFHAALAEPPAGSDYMMNLRWCTETNLYAIEALADIVGVALEPVAEMPPSPAPTQPAHTLLVDWLRHFTPSDPQEAHQTRSAFRLARHLERASQIGLQVESADLDEASGLLGFRPDSSFSGDAALEKFIQVDDGAHDEALIHLFYRRLRRSLSLLGPKGSAIATHYPVPGVSLS